MVKSTKSDDGLQVSTTEGKSFQITEPGCRPKQTQSSPNCQQTQGKHSKHKIHKVTFSKPKDNPAATGCKISFDSNGRQETVASDSPSLTTFKDSNGKGSRSLLLQKVELTPQNSSMTFAGCSFRMSPANVVPVSKDAILQLEINLRSANSLVDSQGVLLDKSVTQGSGMSPYLIAYRQKLRQVRPIPQQSEIVIAPPSIGEIQEQTTFCSCKTSSCLKLYCDCFKTLGFCGPNCKCEGCLNKGENSQERNAAINRTLTSTYGKMCFKSLGHFGRETECDKRLGHSIEVNVLKKTDLFCRCRKSSCGNNYCSCHAGGQRCSERCKCSECHNN